MITLIVLLLLVLTSTFVAAGFIALFAGPKGRGVAFVPASASRIAAMLRLAGMVSGKRMADLGSGDGRIVIVFANAGADSYGYELNPVLAWWSRIHALLRKQSAHFRVANYWNEDFLTSTLSLCMVLRR